MFKNLLTVVSLVSSVSLFAQTSPNLSSWDLNTTGAKGSYATSSGPGGGNSTTDLDDSSGIKTISYDDNKVYITCEGIAEFEMGPWASPNFFVEARGYSYKIPRTPSEETGSKTSVPSGGAIGFAVDGVPFYGYESADSWDPNSNSNTGTGDNIWNSEAWTNEGPTMDESGNGHPANGAYHYHAIPAGLYDDDNSAHSPIIGWMADGYPIYGPYGYDDSLDANSSIAIIQSSYSLRSITVRQVLPDGSSLSASDYGPDVSTTYPLGTYVEDYEYLAGSGHLDEYNGRWCVTPEFPSGTYAYFSTMTDEKEPAFPYLIAAEYYGEVSQQDVANISKATIPTNTTEYTGSVTTSINELSTEDVFIAPNPAKDHLTITSSESITSLVIHDVLGNVVISTTNKNINVSALNRGVYVVVINGSISKRIVLQ